MIKRLYTALAALGLVIGGTACGSDEKVATTTSAAASTTSAASESTSAESAPTETDATDTSTDDTSSDSAFPVTIEHKYGSTTIPSEPTKIVSVGFTDQDFLLSLGVTPIAIRDWYGDQPYGTWPWAQDELGDAKPTLLSSSELNFEEIAALEPDLIVGLSSGMTDTDYATLSKIAPTVAQPEDYIDYGTPWDVAEQMIGDAVGKSAEATAVIEATKQGFADAAEANPEFAGATAAVAFNFENKPGAYSSSDARSRVLADLGFTTPATFDELSGDSFYFSVSQEDLSTFDTDVIVWLTTLDADVDAIKALPLRSSMKAYAEGREVVADPLLAGAFSFSSPLSLDYVLEKLVPELALAVDGDPATAVPSAAGIAGDGAPAASNGFSTDEQAAADAWTAVFDSAVTYADKSAFMEDAAALQSTVESYTAAGDAVGGISLKPTAATIDGDSATITYDVLFGDATAYSALTGEMTLVDGDWTVTRDVFCDFMTSARNPCPAG